jgi:glycerophosphoryl diester phosphodiesterase
MSVKIISSVMVGLSLASFASAKNAPVKIRDIASITNDAVPCLFAKRMEVHGHRGLNGFPNNTLSSFKAAYDVGVDTVELDLQITKDGQILVAHDAVPNVGAERCGVGGKSLGKKALREMTFAETREIRCGTNGYQDPMLDQIPLLSEVFTAFKDRKTSDGKPVHLNIEIKFFADQAQYYPGADEYADLILKVIKESGWSKDRFFVQSFNSDILKVVKAKAADILVVPLVGDANNAEKAALELGTSLVTPGFWKVTPELIFALHRKNIRAIIWTPNTEDEIRMVINSGADGIITDYPDLFFKIRDQLCK